jgi:Fe2+ transport system protein FeoA
MAPYTPCQGYSGRVFFGILLRTSLISVRITTMTTITEPTFEQELIPLSELGEREEAVVHITDLDVDERIALSAMGLHDDATFHLCQQGQPCIVQVEATRLGLSRELTSRIMVRRCGACNEA